MTYVVTYIDVAPDSTSHGLELLRQYCAAAATLKDNAGVAALQETSRPNRFVLIETWMDDASFQANESGEHTVRFRSQLRSIHNSPYDQRVHHSFAVAAEPARAGSADTVSAVTHVDVPPPRREETEVLIRILAEASRKSAGNVRYDVFQQNAPRLNHFTVFAVWNDAVAFDAYQAASHTRQFREVLGPMLGAPYDERIYKSVVSIP